jgi:hypothetical protein
MIAEFGGARIWVPVRSTPGAKLTQLLGDRAAAALCARFGGDYLQVPNTTARFDNIHRRIAELHRQGCKINEIALAVGRSRRTVFRLLRTKITRSAQTWRVRRGPQIAQLADARTATATPPAARTFIKSPLNRSAGRA